MDAEFGQNWQWSGADQRRQYQHVLAERWRAAPSHQYPVHEENAHPSKEFSKIGTGHILGLQERLVLHTE